MTGHWDSLKIGNARADIDCWPRSATNCIDNIWTHYQRILDAGLKDDYPETFFDWRGLDEKTISSSPIWFLKDVWCVRPPQQLALQLLFLLRCCEASALARADRLLGGARAGVCMARASRWSQTGRTTR